MGWTTPVTWVDGTTPAAADFNPQIRDNLRYLKGIDGVPRIENPIELPESATPAQPNSGYARIYPKSSKLFYALDSTNLELPVTRWGARVYNSATQSIANNTVTTLTFDSERYDQQSFHSTSVNTSRLTVPANAGGRYLFGGAFEYASNATGFRAIYLRINGTTFPAIQTTVANNGATTLIVVMGAYELAAGDYIEAQAYQNSGGALNVSASTGYGCEFWIEGPF